MRQITDLDDLIEGFHLYCLAEGKRPKMISWYIPKLHYLRDYLRRNNMPTNPTLITTNYLRAFLVHLSIDAPHLTVFTYSAGEGLWIDSIGRHFALQPSDEVLSSHSRHLGACSDASRADVGQHYAVVEG